MALKCPREVLESRPLGHGNMTHWHCRKASSWALTTAIKLKFPSRFFQLSCHAWSIFRKCGSALDSPAWLSGNWYSCTRGEHPLVLSTLLWQPTTQQYFRPHDASMGSFLSSRKGSFAQWMSRFGVPSRRHRNKVLRPTAEHVLRASLVLPLWQNTLCLSPAPSAVPILKFPRASHQRQAQGCRRYANLSFRSLPAFLLYKTPTHDENARMQLNGRSHPIREREKYWTNFLLLIAQAKLRD